MPSKDSIKKKNDEKECITLDKFPIVVLDYIFQLLSNDDQSAFQTTCRDFYHTFVSGQFMSTIFPINPVFADRSLPDLKEFMQKSPRWRWNFTFYHEYFNETSKSFWKSHGWQINSLRLYECHLSFFSLRSILEYCTNLKELIIKVNCTALRVRSWVDKLTAAGIVNDSVTSFEMTYPEESVDFALIMYTHCEFLKQMPRVTSTVLCRDTERDKNDDEDGETILSCLDEISRTNEFSNNAVVRMLSERSNMSFVIKSRGDLFQEFNLKSDLDFTVPNVQVDRSYNIDRFLDYAQDVRILEVANLFLEKDDLVRTLHRCDNLHTLILRSSYTAEFDEDFSQHLASTNVKTLVIDYTIYRNQDSVDNVKNEKIENLYFYTYNDLISRGPVNYLNFVNLKRLHVFKMSVESVEVLCQSNLDLEEFVLGKIDTAKFEKDVGTVHIHNLPNLKFIGVPFHPRVEISCDLPKLKYFVVYLPTYADFHHITTESSMYKLQPKLFTERILCPELEIISAPPEFIHMHCDYFGYTVHIEKMTAQLMRIIEPLKKIKGVHLQARTKDYIDIEEIRKVHPTFKYFSTKRYVINWDTMEGTSILRSYPRWLSKHVEFEFGSEWRNLVMCRKLVSPYYDDMSGYIFRYHYRMGICRWEHDTTPPRTPRIRAGDSSDFEGGYNINYLFGDDRPEFNDEDDSDAEDDYYDHEQVFLFPQFVEYW